MITVDGDVLLTYTPGPVKSMLDTALVIIWPFHSISTNRVDDELAVIVAALGAIGT